MKILLYGLGNDLTRGILSRFKNASELRDVVLCDKSETLEGYEKIILSPQNVNPEEYDYCIIGSSKYKDDIHNDLTDLGFKETQIIDSDFPLCRRIRAMKYGFVPAWKKKMESGYVEIIQNWYSRENSVECIFRIKDQKWNQLCIDAIMLVPGHQMEMHLINLKTGEEIQKVNDVNLTGSVACMIDSENEIYKLQFDGNCFDIPYVNISVIKSEIGKRIDRLSRKNKFLQFSRAIDTFWYHDEDYLGLRRLKDCEGIILDIGANHGQSMVAFAQMLPKAEIVSIEAVPDLCDILEIIKAQNKYGDRVQIINAGVSNMESELSWYEPDDFSNSGSFDKEFLYRQLSKKAEPSKVMERRIRTQTLDGLLKDRDNIQFIKIDVEGLEEKVIEGSMKIIKKDYPIILIEKNNLRNRIINLLSEWYELRFYDPDADSFVKKEGECMMSINYWLIPKEIYRRPWLRKVEGLN